VMLTRRGALASNRSGRPFRRRVVDLRNSGETDCAANLALLWLRGGPPMAKARIAHLAGPNATIQNTPPLITSNKARAMHGLPLLTDSDGTPGRFDVLRPQRLAAPVTVYVEQFSAHPLEVDSAELYGALDGYVD